MGLEPIPQRDGSPGHDPRGLRNVDRAGVRAGRWLFAHRSLTPLPLLLMIVGYLALQVFPAADSPQSITVGTGKNADEPVGPHALSRATTTRSGTERGWTDLLAAVCVILGCAGRAYVVRSVPPGACGRGRRIEASELVTAGAYAHTRNPLYFANLLICVGLMIELGSWVLGAAVSVFFFVQYWLVIQAEEALLLERFGDRYRKWAGQVPGFVPTLTAAPGSRDSRGVMDVGWRAALAREADTWFAALGGFVLLAIWRSGEVVPVFAVGWVALAVLAVLYVSIKISRRSSKRRGRPD